MESPIHCNSVVKEFGSTTAEEAIIAQKEACNHTNVFALHTRPYFHGLCPNQTENNAPIHLPIHPQIRTISLVRSNKRKFARYTQEQYDCVRENIWTEMECQNTEAEAQLKAGVAQLLLGLLTDRPDLLHGLDVFEDGIERLGDTRGHLGAVPLAAHAPDIVHQIGVDLLELLHGAAAGALSELLVQVRDVLEVKD